MENIKTGQFVISLDFELFWGVWDVATKDNYGANIIGVKKALPAMLDAFKVHNVKVTMATVGFLFAKNKTNLLENIPNIKPNYSLENYDVYKKEIASIGENEDDDAYHFGYSLLQLIKNEEHEIATHTFSHYYCLEDGQTAEAFDADIKAAIQIAKENNVRLSSIVFPRNQINKAYLAILKQNNINCYRGNPTSWIFTPRKFGDENLFIRMCRLLDAYTSIFGHNIFDISASNNLPVNVAGSRFLKPYSSLLSFLEKRKVNRILNEMTIAAKQKKLYHLWWHPHNFGTNLEKNMANLNIILSHYKMLENKYGFKNCTMKEAAGV